MSNVLKVSLQTTIYSLAPARLVAAPDSTRSRDQPRHRRPIFIVGAAGKTGHFDPSIQKPGEETPAIFGLPAKASDERVNARRRPKLQFN
jgi:hypothetical protein